MSVPELSVQLKNIPGQLVQITAVLAESGINIRALTASSAGKTGWVRIIVDKAKLASEALDDCGFTVDMGEAIAIRLDDTTGTTDLDRALRLLADEKINVDYVYTCLEPRTRRNLAIIGVQTPGKAEKLLMKDGLQIIDMVG